MPVAEIAAAITSSQAALNIAKAMVGLRDAEMMRSRSIELQGLILESLSKSIEAREAQSAQLDTIRALETEVARLKDWGAEKQQYEMVAIGRGGTAFMLKPESRGSKPPHWLCPNCFENGKKSFFQPKLTTGSFGAPYECVACKAGIVGYVGEVPAWKNDSG